jgi:hypothetical protein
MLRAFAWLRWRVLINSLERRGSRDVIERFSAAFEQLAPVIAALMMVPSAVALAGLGAYAGWRLGQGEAATAFGIVRLLLFAACVLTIVGPILLPAAERTNAIRLLLLPIPRGVLYLTQSMSALADPWIVLAGVLVIAVVAGIAGAGHTGVAVVALAAALLLLLALVGLTQLATSTVHLVIRDRRRAELLGLLIVVVLPVLAMLPGLLGSEGHRSQESAVEGTRPVERERRWSGIEARALAAVPSEMYARAARSAATSRSPAAGIGSLATLGGLAIALHAIAMVAFARVLSSPGAVGATRSTTAESGSGWRLPGLSAAVSAVSVNQLRLALRTPRGRATLLSPLVVFGLFTVMMVRSRNGIEVGPWQVESGLGLGAFASFVSLLSILPLAMNQFAIDRAGLTLALLTPLPTRALLLGKAIGNALVVALPMTICLAGAAALFPSGDPRLWLCIPLTLLSAYLMVAPVAAMLSAVFPRPVDLNSIGRNSNAHGAAGLLGMLAFLAAEAPGLAIALIVGQTMGRPGLAVALLAVWVGVCLAIGLVLFRAAEALFERRKENLGMTSQRPV